jgi:hypothetical protein
MHDVDDYTGVCQYLISPNVYDSPESHYDYDAGRTPLSPLESDTDEDDDYSGVVVNDVIEIIESDDDYDVDSPNVYDSPENPNDYDAGRTPPIPDFSMCVAVKDPPRKSEIPSRNALDQSSIYKCITRMNAYIKRFVSDRKINYQGFLSV